MKNRDGSIPYPPIKPMDNLEKVIEKQLKELEAEHTQLTLYCQGLKDKIAALEDK